MTVTSPAIGIANVLIAAGVQTTGWTIYVGGLMTEDDQQIVVRHIGGKAGEIALAIDYPAIQLLVRGQQGPGGYESAYEKLINCRDALVRIPSGPTAFPNLTLVKTIGDVLDLGRDDKSRPLFSLNLSLIVTYDSAGYRS